MKNVAECSVCVMTLLCLLGYIEICSATYW